MKIQSMHFVPKMLSLGLLALAAADCTPTCGDCAKIGATCSAGSSGTGASGAGVGGASVGGASGGGGEAGIGGVGGFAPAGPEGFPYKACLFVGDCNDTALQNAGYDKNCLVSTTTCPATDKFCYAIMRPSGQCNRVGATNSCYKSGSGGHSTSCVVFTGGAPACQWGACN